MSRELTTNDVGTLEWWTVREVANLFRVSPDTIHRRIKSGHIRCVPFGDKSRRIHRDEVERLRRSGLPTVEAAAPQPGHEWNTPQYVKP